MSDEDLMVGETKVDRVTKEQLIELLNEDLANEYQAIITYIQYAASVHGPYRRELKSFFLAEIPDETMHAQFLADKISALGGIPTVTPAPVLQETDAKKMLQNVAEAERKARNDYSVRSKQAESLGEMGLSSRLDSMVEDEAGHLDETLKILHGWE